MVLIFLFSIFALTRAHHPQVDRLLKDYFEWKIDTFKVTYYSRGFNKHAGEMDDYDENAFHKVGDKCGHFQDRADELLRQIGNELDIRDKRYVKVLKKESEFCVRGMEAEGYFLPDIHFMSGVQTSWPSFFKEKSNFRLKSYQDYRDVLKLLQKIPKQLDQIQILCEKGIGRKLTFHEASMSRVENQFDNLLSVENPEDTKFFVPFESATKDIQESAKATIQNDVLPAFKKLRDFVLTEYKRHTRKWPGISSVPNGEQRYQRYLEYHTTIEGITPEEVHNMGLDEVKRLQELAMSTAGVKLGFSNATFKMVAESLKIDPDQEFFSTDEVMKYFRNINDKIEPKLPKIMDPVLLNNDTYHLNIKPVPPGGGGYAYYKGPTVDGRRKGAFYVNINNLQNIKKFETYSLTLHEGNPGHHLQISFNKYSPSPDFLKYTRTSYSNPGSPLGYTSHIEGWGLYSEYLGHEMGMFDDPEQEIGFYSWNLLRACRLVVDTGLHVFGWSRQRAIDYLSNNTALSLPAIEGQIDRYITWPAQATAYKIGEIKIREIRQRREKALGSNFNLGAFHRHVLTCIGPIGMLEECIKEEEQLPFPSNATLIHQGDHPLNLATEDSQSAKEASNASNIIPHLLTIILSSILFIMQ